MRLPLSTVGSSQGSAAQNNKSIKDTQSTSLHHSNKASLNRATQATLLALLCLSGIKLPQPVRLPHSTKVSSLKGPIIWVDAYLMQLIWVRWLISGILCSGSEKIQSMGAPSHYLLMTSALIVQIKLRLRLFLFSQILTSLLSTDNSEMPIFTSQR